MSYSHDGKPVDELDKSGSRYFIHFMKKQRLKQKRLLLDYSKKGLDVVTVNPTRVYGPGKLTRKQLND